MGIDWTGCDEVEQVPGKVSGVPILKHSRVQADAIWENFPDASVAEIADMFSLPVEQVKAVIDFAQKQAASRGLPESGTKE